MGNLPPQSSATGKENKKTISESLRGFGAKIIGEKKPEPITMTPQEVVAAIERQHELNKIMIAQILTLCILMDIKPRKFVQMMWNETKILEYQKECRFEEDRLNEQEMRGVVNEAEALAEGLAKAQPDGVKNFKTEEEAVNTIKNENVGKE